MKADVFFFITAVAVLVVGAGLLAVIISALRIMREIRMIVALVRAQAQAVSMDIESVRAAISDKGFAWGALSSIFKKWYSGKREEKGRKVKVKKL